MSKGKEDEAIIIDRDHYPTENIFDNDGKKKGCQEDTWGSGLTFDNRWRETGLQVSEYVLQENSGVLEKLKKVKHIDLFYQNEMS